MEDIQTAHTGEVVPTRNLEKVKAIILYWSQTGNTEKVAKAIKRGMESQGVKPSLKRIEEIKDEILLDYDLVCIGAPTWSMLPPPNVIDFCKKISEEYKRLGLRKLQSPLLPGKYGAVFCTCGGPHTGLDESIPAGEWLRSFLEHMGIDVHAKWYVAGEFETGMEKLYDIKGRLGDIRGRPNAQDLTKVENNAAELIRKLRLVLGESGK